MAAKARRPAQRIIHLRRARARPWTIVEEQRRAGEEGHGDRGERRRAAGVRFSARFEEKLIDPEVAPRRVLDGRPEADRQCNQSCRARQDAHRAGGRFPVAQGPRHAEQEKRQRRIRLHLRLARNQRREEGDPHDPAEQAHRADGRSDQTKDATQTGGSAAQQQRLVRGP